MLSSLLSLSSVFFGDGPCNLPAGSAIMLGKYYIRSHFDYLCADTVHGAVIHCGNEVPTIWSYEKDGNGKFYLGSNRQYWSSSAGTIELISARKTPITVEVGARQVTENDPSEDALKLDVLHGNSFKLRFSDLQDSYLDARNKNSIVAHHHCASKTQEFVFIPAESQNSQKVSYRKLQSRSNEFQKNIGKFPLKSNTIKAIVGDKAERKQAVVMQATGIQILMAVETFDLISKYLIRKKIIGNATERVIYHGMTVEGFIDRLLTKRPLVLYTHHEFTVLQSAGTDQLNPMQEYWKLVGREVEGPILMNDYLSHEEMELAALIVVSVPTYFVNSGERYNCGQAAPSPYPVTGYYIAAVGACFEQPGIMEARHMTVERLTRVERIAFDADLEPMELVPFDQIASDADQEPMEPVPFDQIAPKATDDPIKRLWNTFYQKHSFRYDKYSFTLPEMDTYLHKDVYGIRLWRILYPILLQAERLGVKHDKRVVLRLVGFGLGTWAVTTEAQTEIYIDVVRRIVTSNVLYTISTIDMLWMSEVERQWIIKDLTGKAIVVNCSRGDPAAVVGPGELLVATYGGRGGSFPGNEYWAGELSTSGDPAAACCSTIQELQNPYINPCFNARNALQVFI